MSMNSSLTGINFPLKEITTMVSACRKLTVWGSEWGGGKTAKNNAELQSVKGTVGGKTVLCYRRSTLKQAPSLRREPLKALRVCAGVASEIAFNYDLKKNRVLNISNLKV